VPPGFPLQNAMRRVARGGGKPQFYWVCALGTSIETLARQLKTGIGIRSVRSKRSVRSPHLGANNIRGTSNMSRYHGDQYWTEIQTRAIRDWRGFGDDDIDALHALRREREVRTRDERAKARNHRRNERREFDA
jgi:hypothetical protein